MEEKVSNSFNLILTQKLSDFNICSFIVGLLSRHFCVTGSKSRNSNKKVRSLLSLTKVNWTESFNCVCNHQAGGTWSEDVLEQHYKVKLCDDWRWDEYMEYGGYWERRIKYILQTLHNKTKYFRLRLSNEVSDECQETWDLRQT